MKRINIKYNNTGDLIQIFVKESNGKKLDSYIFNGSNEEVYGKVIESLYQKYGWRPLIQIKECINFKNKTEDKGFFEV